MILIIIEKMLIFIERVRNQKVDKILDQYWLSVSKIIIGLLEYCHISASLIVTIVTLNFQSFFHYYSWYINYCINHLVGLLPLTYGDL